MRKLYASLGMLVSCGLAFAAMPNAQFHKLQQAGQKADIKIEKSISSNKMNKPAKAPTMADIEGQYEWVAMGATTNSYLDLNNGDVTMFINDEKPNELIVYGINVLNEISIAAEVDLAKGTVSFPTRQYITTQDGIDFYFLHLEWNAAGNGFQNPNSPLVGTIDTSYSSLAITFDPNDLIAIWAEDLEIGGYVAQYFNSMQKRPEKLDSTDWNDGGTATVSELWLQFLVEYGTDQVIGQWQVPYQVNKSNPNLIRLVDPYGQNTPYANYNISQAEGSIVFDITDPEAVGVIWLSEVPFYTYTDENGNEGTLDALIGNYSGFMGSDGAYYPGNEVGFALFEGFSYDDIKTDITNAGTFNGNTITITDPNWNMSFYLEYLGTAFQSKGDLGTPTIVLDNTGVESIYGNDLNAPVKYYNIQGMEIQNPAKGQIVIKKQGNTTSKFIAR